MNEEDPFILRPYTKAELAHLYNPGMPLVSALRKLREWVKGNNMLTEELRACGAKTRDRGYTRHQVRIITKYLGEP